MPHQRPVWVVVRIAPEIGEQASVDFQITLRATSAGRHKLRAQISSSQLDAPLASDAAIVILGSGS